MKTLFALASILLIASPATARPTLQQSQIVLDGKEAALEAYKRGDKAEACRLYTKAQNYSEANGLDVFWPAPSNSPKVIELNHQINEKTAEINQTVNENGRGLCGSAWRHRNLPTTYTRL